VDQVGAGVLECLAEVSRRRKDGSERSAGSDMKARRRLCAAWRAIPDELTTQRMLLGAADFNGENLWKFEL